MDADVQTASDPALPPFLGHLPSSSDAPRLSPRLTPESPSSHPRSLLSRSGTPNMRTSKPSTPRPPPDPEATVAPSVLHKSPEGRALNVTDALSYLDAVKVQFHDKPDVYNHFLDIMKDFKSQVIDTPGVIQRVSKLFHGNPVLIQGFNTFLPVGYRIEVSSDPMDPNTITVTTPSGTTTQNTFARRDFPAFPSQANTPTFPGAPLALPGFGSAALSRSHTPHGFHAPGQPPFETSFSPGFQNPQTTAAASVLGNLNGNRNVVESQPPDKISGAIHYLNKIKARYADDQNTYKQFLDILHTYQKEQRHLQDSQVYVQVQALFKDAPDLLEEFKAFLPENSAAIPGPSGSSAIPKPMAPSASTGVWNQTDSVAAEKTAKKSTQPAKRKKRPVEKEPTPIPPAKAAPSRSKKIKHGHKPDSGSPSYSPLIQPQSPILPPQHVVPQLSSSQLLPQNAQVPLPPMLAMGTSADRLLFFDRAKKSLESREMYEDFLKLLSLFSKEIIDIRTLVDRTRVFLGDSELLTEFKELVGWSDRDGIENGPPGSIRTGPPEALSALPADDGEGPSYRRLPESEIRLACSGRDELCRSVLNDEWVSHPTWASEESGFVAHKKNSFEEALHKSEEERYEYQVHIEGLSRTISLLEPLNARIESMTTTEERTLFKLRPDFGGPSKSIYHRLIKKVYGRDSGTEVIQALQDCPAVAVPVVLARLKQKEEEWRRAQREWNRTWREVDSKNFYKSLDNQGITFKANDKKSITAKHFVADIEAIKAQQTEKMEEDGIPSFSYGSVDPQLKYSYEDTFVLLDTLKMVYSFLDRSQAQYNSQERRSVEKFLRTFIPMICMYPDTEFNAACGPLEGPHDDDGPESVHDGARSGRRSVGSTSSMQSGGVAASDLRKKLLRTMQERANAKGPNSATASRDVTPNPEIISSDTERSDVPPDIWITEAGTEAYAENVVFGTDSERPFFVSTTFYTLLRLLQLLYFRLSVCKEIGAQHAARKHSSLVANRVAVELGLDDPNGPSALLAQTIEALGERGAGENANVVYMYLLNACEKLFDNEIDQPTFEEHMRWFFGNKAYYLFTLDKVITALVKQVQTILSDNKCQELWKLLRSAQHSEIITYQDVVRYRREAERHIGQDDPLYRLQWVRKSKTLCISLIGPTEPSVGWSPRSSLSRWRGYADTYVLSYVTEWVPTEKKQDKPVFLRRTMRAEEDTALIKEGGLRIRVSLPSYKLVFEQGTEEVVWRRYNAEELGTLEERAASREEERRRCRLIK